MENLRTSTKLKLSQHNEQAARLKSSLEENNNQILSLQAEINEWCNHSSENIRSSVNMLYESLEKEEERAKLNTKYKHVKRHLNLQDTEQKNSERFVLEFEHLGLKFY